MRLAWKSWCRERKSLIVLSPQQDPCHGLASGVWEEDYHAELLGKAQRLRGRIYLSEGALRSSDLTADGRHLQAADATSYHLLELDEGQRVVGCLRYHIHPSNVAFSELTVSGAAIAQSDDWGAGVRTAIETEIDSARRAGAAYAELGGWAMAEQFRGTDPIRLLLLVYAFARHMGGALGVTMATTRHRSSTILRRMGGKPLTIRDYSIQPYFDPRFGCEMELLRFDSRAPNEQYEDLIREYETQLHRVPTIFREPTLRPEAMPLNAGLLSAAPLF